MFLPKWNHVKFNKKSGKLGHKFRNFVASYIVIKCLDLFPSNLKSVHGPRKSCKLSERTNLINVKNEPHNNISDIVCLFWHPQKEWFMLIFRLVFKHQFDMFRERNTHNFQCFWFCLWIFGWLKELGSYKFSFYNMQNKNALRFSVSRLFKCFLLIPFFYKSFRFQINGLIFLIILDGFSMFLRIVGFF